MEVPRDKVSKYGIIDAEEFAPGLYRIRGVKEKPDMESAPSRLALVGRYVLTPEVFTHLEAVKPDHTGEIQLTDALQSMARENRLLAVKLRGQRFDDAAVSDLAERASLVIAHNAAFDRPFVEKRFPFFAAVPWACTVTQIDWQAERLPARSLEFLLFKFGWCINAHRALDDAEGVLGLLLDQLPQSGRPVLKALLEASTAASSRIYAVGAPFDKKELLKQRGYRWSDGSGSMPKSWWISVPESQEQDELAFLSAQVYPQGGAAGVDVRRVGPLDRFSIREG
jgi:hypothetical protein